MAEWLTRCPAKAVPSGAGVRISLVSIFSLFSPAILFEASFSKFYSQYELLRVNFNKSVKDRLLTSTLRMLRYGSFYWVHTVGMYLVTLIKTEKSIDITLRQLDSTVILVQLPQVK
ncbi:hypothetical protein F4680DRAFT_415918 [Xylaria scruposa]|nr:hypothetical protein F4680DRAFT_415918 [Xylaria scruposa]